MNLLFTGPPGSGKGTQAKIIAKKLRIPHISTGDMLRNVKGELKKEVDSYMKEGKLIPTDITLKLLKARFEEKDCKSGFILDGFPRSLEQAKEIDKIVKIGNAFNIGISDNEALRRLSGRLNCRQCGAVYNLLTSPKPKNDTKCDKDGSQLYQREDDMTEAIKKRLQIYHQDTKPLLKHYNSVKINGEQSIEKVTEDIMKAVKFLNMFK